MSSFKKLLTRTLSGDKKQEIEYSSRRAMVTSPPPGKVTDRDDPHHEIWKPQFSSGDQTDKGRLPFFNSGFAACPECGERNVWRFEEKAGIKPNGDTYGTELFICQTKECGWRTSFKYDDGVPGSTYFETLHWPRGIMKFPVSFLMMWADKHDLSQIFKHQIFSKEITGDQLLEFEAMNCLQEKLHINKKEAEKVRKALSDPRGAVLIRNTK
uniref:Uncharacterized protein n=1 Tax=Arion vulgaris TaxID=1028688 RepID=A0A0B6ZR39_9EUPU